MTRIAPAAVVLLLMMPIAARAQVALVEEINSKSAGLQSMAGGAVLEARFAACGITVRAGRADHQQRHEQRHRCAHRIDHACTRGPGFFT